MRFLKISLLLMLLSGQSLANAGINHYFDEVKKDPNALYAFLKAMPKGGELHYHLSGGAYPEVLLALAAQGDYCLNIKTFTMTPTTKVCSGVKSSELMNHPDLYRSVMRAWSMKDFVPGKESGHDHFFATFYKFMPVAEAHHASLLAAIMQVAAAQNEHYLEIMVQPDNGQSATFARGSLSMNQLAAEQQQLLANKAFQANINTTVDEAAALLKEARRSLKCDKKPLQGVCQITVKFQYYVLREQSIEKFFPQALTGFVAASRSKDLVGVNLVMPEDGIISLRDYHKQMQVFSFLHHAYPAVHIALHAGELDPETVAPNNLRFHIREAIATGHAERIGHGVDIAFEENAEQLLKAMAIKPIAVEINLTSNKKILNCFGRRHPLRYYLAHKVPVILSTDDEGVLRTDLTRQYLEAVLTHGIDYPMLKKINRNALTYSFLPGKSLWADPAAAEPVNACKQLQSPLCLEYIKTNEKARLQWELENALRVFESKMMLSRSA